MAGRRGGAAGAARSSAAPGLKRAAGSRLLERLADHQNAGGEQREDDEQERGHVHPIARRPDAAGSARHGDEPENDDANARQQQQEADESQDDGPAAAVLGRRQQVGPHLVRLTITRIAHGRLPAGAPRRR